MSRLFVNCTSFYHGTLYITVVYTLIILSLIRFSVTFNTLVKTAGYSSAYDSPFILFVSHQTLWQHCGYMWARKNFYFELLSGYISVKHS